MAEMMKEMSGSGGMLALRTHFSRLYVFTLMWSIGALLELDDRCKLETFLRQDEFSSRLDLPAIQLDTDQTIFDFTVNENGLFKITFILS